MLVSIVFFLLHTASCHFVLKWPPSRGFDDGQAISPPCGGFNDISSPRTEWPATGGPIQLELHHTRTNVSVLIAIKDDPGSSFSVFMRTSITVEGLGSFCLDMIKVPTGVQWLVGNEATIQIVTNGDQDGGLYQVSFALDTSGIRSWTSNSIRVAYDLTT